MNILVLSTLYPPFHVGGYELGCRDVVERLRQRGHAVSVLTSTYGIDGPRRDGSVYRWLRSDLGTTWRSPAEYWIRMLRKELHNRSAFKRLAQHLAPQILYIWSMRYISLAPIFMAQQMRIPTCYYVSDDWLAHVESIDRWRRPLPHPLKRAVKRLLDLALDVSSGMARTGALRLDCAQFTSQHLRSAAIAAGKPVASARVIPWGVDGAQFPFRPAPRAEINRLLYVGQLSPHKGVHTAIDALRRIREGGRRDVTLTIAGGTILPDYEAHLRELVLSYQLDAAVRFSGPLPRDHLPQVYQEHDILVFPSIWDEPFSITLLEAMSSGLAVVGTPTGGSAEILAHEANALVFPKEDAQACAVQVARLLADRALFERIRLAARRTVGERFQLAQMVDAIESHLQDAVKPRCA